MMPTNPPAMFRALSDSELAHAIECACARTSALYDRGADTTMAERAEDALIAEHFRRTARA